MSGATKTIEEKLKIARELKEVGNSHFQKGEYQKAIEFYHKCNMYVMRPGRDSSNLPQLIENERPTQEQDQEFKSLSTIVLLNMAATHLKLNKPEKAIDECSKVLHDNPKNPKALFRRGQGYFAIRNHDKAEVDFKQVLELNPEDKAVQQYLSEIKKIARENEKKRKNENEGTIRKTLSRGRKDSING